MNGKHGFVGAVFLVFCAGPLVQVQAPMALPQMNSTPSSPLVDSPILQKPVPLAPVNDPDLSVPTYSPSDSPGLKALAGCDPWIYSQPQTNTTTAGPFGGCCGCGTIGGSGPIGADIYVRTGPSIIVSDTAFGKALHTGYEVSFGGRSLFFNQAADKAWVVDLSMAYTYNDGHGSTAFNYGGVPVTIRSLDRDAIGLGLGRDWYLFGPGNVGSTGTNLCFGTDLGARWGTSHLDMNIINTNNGYLRHQGIYASAFAAAHLDLIVPMDGWAFITGIRTEWSYDNLSLLEGPSGAQTSLHNINILLTMGVRY